MNILDYTYIEFQYFVMIFFRVIGIIFFAPLFGSKNVPNNVKIILGLVLAWVIFGINKDIIKYIPITTGAMVVFIVKEFLIGMCLGLIMLLLLIGAQIAGQLVGMDMGFAMANVIDPQTNAQVSIFSEVKYILAIMIFIFLEGHYIIIETLTKSFSIIPLNNIFINNKFYEMVVKFASYMFVMGIKLAAPEIVSLFIVSVSLGFLARSVPQMNVFAVGYSIKIAIGFIVTGLAISIFSYILKNAIINFEDKLSLILSVI